MTHIGAEKQLLSNGGKTLWENAEFPQEFDRISVERPQVASEFSFL
jgi:hypothetical protein